MIEPLAILPILVMIAAMAAGRRIQGGGLNWAAWWPRSTALGRAVYALIAGICAGLLTGDPVKAGLVALGWFAGCSISLLDSIGRDDAMWRGCARGAVQCAVPTLALIAADAMGLLTAGHLALLWPVIGALMGPIYRLTWRQDKMEPTVLGEWLTGAAWGIGMVLALI